MGIRTSDLVRDHLPKEQVVELFTADTFDPAEGPNRHAGSGGFEYCGLGAAAAETEQSDLGPDGESPQPGKLQRGRDRVVHQLRRNG
jgi:hypothetical protein